MTATFESAGSPCPLAETPSVLSILTIALLTPGARVTRTRASRPECVWFVLRPVNRHLSAPGLLAQGIDFSASCATGPIKTAISLICAGE